MDLPRRFVIVENSEAGSLLLARTLKRKFPTAEVVQCLSAPAFRELASDGAFDLFIVHRVAGEDPDSLVRHLKLVRPAAPVIMVSGIDREEEARASGADAFLPFDEWLMLGPLVERLLPPARRETKEPDPV